MPPRSFGSFVFALAFGLLIGGSFAAQAAEPAKNGDSGKLSLVLRQRESAGKDAGPYRVTFTPETWDARKSAVIVCDMWDTHHSENAAHRTAELAKRMNQVLIEARRRGATIIHAPSRLHGGL